ncbi:unnamed protein product [Prunus brigantina]
MARFREQEASSSSFPTFRDEEELERGKDIKPEFEKAIQQSRSSVIVFSKDYPSSRWCLDELVLILKQKRISYYVVLPVFYNVDPSHLRHQTGSVGEAFARHEENQQSPNKVKQWRAALREVADLAGMVLQNQANGYESKFVKQIVKVVDEKLSRMPTPFIVASYLIGIDSRVKYINSWLNDGSADVDVRETSRQPNGLVQLQLQFLYHILSGREVKIHSVSEGIKKNRDAIIPKRVLLVLDDVDDMHQIKSIFGMLDWFYLHSKIIITTRYAGLLRDHELSTCKVYNIETLKANESLELFSWHAFGQAHPCEDYMKLSEMIADGCKGLPLALQVLGSSQFGRTIDVWKSALEKLKAIPNNEILQRLRISYDAVQDNPHDQNLFLHLHASLVLDGCDFFTIVGIENLLDRCLVTVDESQKVSMHQMICDMGREIVHLESKEPEKRSRLWNDTDSFNVLREKSVRIILFLCICMHFFPFGAYIYCCLLIQMWSFLPLERSNHA